MRVGDKANVPNVGVWAGQLYSLVDSHSYLLSHFVGACVAIWYRHNGQLMFLVKEVLVWTDANFNPVEAIYDPVQERIVKVVQVYNEPAIRCLISLQSLSNIKIAPTKEYFDMGLRFDLDYPNPISVQKHLAWSSDGNYKATEQFIFRVFLQMYEEPNPTVYFTWERESIPYPWMLTGPKHGYTQSMTAEGEIGPYAWTNANAKLKSAILQTFPNFSLDIHSILKDPQVPCQTTWTNIAHILAS
jgi:hypothetical protein